MKEDIDRTVHDGLTVKELKEILKNVPDDMKFFVSAQDDEGYMTPIGEVGWLSVIHGCNQITLNGK